LDDRLEDGSWMPEVFFVKNSNKGPDHQTKSFAVLSESILV
jgi:hypothetical protein